MGDLSWQKRLAIVLSVAWLAVVAAISSSESNGFAVFLLIGALPIAFCWGIGWVWSGFRKQRPPKPTAPSPEARPDESVSRATLYVWVGALLLAAGLGIFYYAFVKTDVEAAGKVGYLVGFYFWVPILVYVLWKSTFNKRKGIGLLLFGVAFLGISIYQSHAMLKEAEDAKLLLSKAQAMMLKLMNGELVERSQISDVGQYSSVLLVMHDFISRTMSDFQTLNTKIETSGLETMLSPATLQSPRAITEAVVTLESLAAVIDQTETRLTSNYDEFPRVIDTADIPYNVRAVFKTGAEDGIQRGRAALTEYFKIQRTFIATAVDLLAFMRERQGRFTRQGDQILFDAQADADKYNEYLQLIQALALQESEWRNAQLSTSAKQLEKMHQ